MSVSTACAASVTYLPGPGVEESASRLSDVAFRTCLADTDGPADLLARGLAALWFERDLARVAGALPRDLESAETALAAVARRRTDPRAEANASAAAAAAFGGNGARPRFVCSTVPVMLNTGRCDAANRRARSSATASRMVPSATGNTRAARRAANSLRNAPVTADTPNRSASTSPDGVRSSESSDGRGLAERGMTGPCFTHCR